MPPINSHKRYKRIKYHGNWCGPGWSAGKFQDSVDEDYPAIDEFDETCKTHDRAYARGEDLKAADMAFYEANVGKGIKRTAAAYAVGLQGKLRSLPEKNNMLPVRGRSRSSNRVRSASAPPTPRASVQRGRRRTRSTSANRSTSRNVRRRLFSPSRSRSRSFSRSRSRASSSRGRGSSGSVHMSTNSVSRMRSLGKLGTLQTQGVQITIEHGNTFSSSSAVYIGHATCPSNVMRRGIYRALVKKILIAARKLNNKWDAVPLFNVATDEIRITYRQGLDPGATAVNHTVIVGGNTQEGIAGQFYSHFETVQMTQSVFMYITYIPAGATLNPNFIGVTTIDLQKCYIKMSVNSNLKIQNRTVSVTADNEADDVNNVPLIGKSYSGTGTGAKFVHSTAGNVPFVADNFKGVIQRAGNVNELAEPPSPRLFDRVQKHGTVSLEPGEIMTSNLKYTKSILLDNLIAIAYNEYEDAQAGHRYHQKYIGFFKFFGLEKKIDAVASTSENVVNVAYEHDLKVTMCISPRTNTLTTSLYLQDFGNPVQ